MPYGGALGGSESMSDELSVNEYRQQRIENMEKLSEAGYPAFERLLSGPID